MSDPIVPHYICQPCDRRHSTRTAIGRAHLHLSRPAKAMRAISEEMAVVAFVGEPVQMAGGLAMPAPITLTARRPTRPDVGRTISRRSLGGGTGPRVGDKVLVDDEPTLVVE